MAAKTVQKVNKGIRFEQDTWLKFSKTAIELGQNRSRLLNNIVRQWLDNQSQKQGVKS